MIFREAMTFLIVACRVYHPAPDACIAKAAICLTDKADTPGVPTTAVWNGRTIDIADWQKTYDRCKEEKK